jgi:hypothetical protein
VILASLLLASLEMLRLGLHMGSTAPTDELGL